MDSDHVIPAKAGIQDEKAGFLDARLRGHDGVACVTIMWIEGSRVRSAHRQQLCINAPYEELAQAHLHIAALSFMP